MDVLEPTSFAPTCATTRSATGARDTAITSVELFPIQIFYLLVGCHDAWRGDQECHEACNNAECNWDGGDCHTLCSAMGSSVDSTHHTAALQTRKPKKRTLYGHGKLKVRSALNVGWTGFVSANLTFNLPDRKSSNLSYISRFFRACGTKKHEVN